MRVLNKTSRKKTSRKGFTLSEILIAVGLMAVVATAAIGGLVVLTNARNTIEKQTQAEMIMIATVGYLREDLNCCTNPHTMDCSSNVIYYDLNESNGTLFTSDANKFGPDFFVLETNGLRYSNVIIRDKVKAINAATLGTAVCDAASVQYCNFNGDPTLDPQYNYNGIYVGINYAGVSAPSGTLPAGKNWSEYFDRNQYVRRKYVIAQNVMEGTGLYSRIKDGLITWNNTDKLFQFTIEVVDEISGEVILSQYVEVCPDTLLPNAPYNP